MSVCLCLCVYSGRLCLCVILWRCCSAPLCPVPRPFRLCSACLCQAPVCPQKILPASAPPMLYSSTVSWWASRSGRAGTPIPSMLPVSGVSLPIPSLSLFVRPCVCCILHHAFWNTQCCHSSNTHTNVVDSISCSLSHTSATYHSATSSHTSPLTLDAHHHLDILNSHIFSSRLFVGFFQREICQCGRHFVQFDFVVTHTYIVFAHPSSTSSPRAVGRRVCQNSVVGLGLGLVIMMIIG